MYFLIVFGDLVVVNLFFPSCSIFIGLQFWFDGLHTDCRVLWNHYGRIVAIYVLDALVWMHDINCICLNPPWYFYFLLFHSCLLLVWLQWKPYIIAWLWKWVLDCLVNFSVALKLLWYGPVHFCCNPSDFGALLQSCELPCNPTNCFAILYILCNQHTI